MLRGMRRGRIATEGTEATENEEEATNCLIWVRSKRSVDFEWVYGKRSGTFILFRSLLPSSVSSEFSVAKSSSFTFNCSRPHQPFGEIILSADVGQAALAAFEQVRQPLVVEAQ